MLLILLHIFSDGEVSVRRDEEGNLDRDDHKGLYVERPPPVAHLDEEGRENIAKEYTNGRGKQHSCQPTGFCCFIWCELISPDRQEYSHEHLTKASHKSEGVKCVDI